MCAARARRGRDFEWRACWVGWGGFEGLRRDLRSDRCLNLSDRCVLERKNSAGVGQAITGLYQKRDMSCGSATYLGDYGIGYFSSFPHPCEKP